MMTIRFHVGRACAVALALVLVACAAPTPTPNPNPRPSATPSQETRTHLDAARAALKTNQLDQALSEAQAAVGSDPNNAEAHFLLGNVFSQLAGANADETERRANLAKAVDAYLTAIKLDAGYDAAYTNLATVYYQNGQFDEAQKRVETALKINPSDAVSHYVLGTIHLQRDPAQVPETWDKAQQEFEAALELDPSLGAAHTALANVYLFKVENQKALEHAQKGVELTRGAPNPYSYWALAQAQCALGDRAGTAASIDAIDGLKPTDTLFIQQVQALAERCK